MRLPRADCTRSYLPQLFAHTHDTRRWVDVKEQHDVELRELVQPAAEGQMRLYEPRFRGGGACGAITWLCHCVAITFLECVGQSMRNPCTHHRDPSAFHSCTLQWLPCSEAAGALSTHLQSSPGSDNQRLHRHKLR